MKNFRHSVVDPNYHRPFFKFPIQSDATRSCIFSDKKINFFLSFLPFDTWFLQDVCRIEIFREILFWFSTVFSEEILFLFKISRETVQDVSINSHFLLSSNFFLLIYFIFNTTLSKMVAARNKKNKKNNLFDCFFAAVVAAAPLHLRKILRSNKMYRRLPAFALWRTRNSE